MSGDLRLTKWGAGVWTFLSTLLVFRGLPPGELRLIFTFRGSKMGDCIDMNLELNEELVRDSMSFKFVISLSEGGLCSGDY